MTLGAAAGRAGRRRTTIPAALFEPRVWTIAAAARRSRRGCERGGGADSRQPAAVHRRRRRRASTAKRPTRCGASSTRTGIAVGETQAGKGALPDPHPLSLGGVGATGTRGGEPARRATPISCIVIGSRLSDFTTASKTAFQHERVRFIAINVAELDAVQARARCRSSATRARCSRSCCRCVAGYRVGADYTRVGRRRWQSDWRGGSRSRLCRTVASPQAATSAQSPQVQSASRKRTSSACCRTPWRRPTSSSAPLAACRATCTSCGAPAIRRAITSSTATRAWATRSPAGSA